MNLKIGLLAATCILSAGCVSTSGRLALDPPSPDGATSNDSRSEKVPVVMTRLVAKKFGRRAGELPAIAVLVTNRGSQPLEFSTAKVQAFADSAPVKVYQSFEYAELVRQEAEIESLAARAREQGAMIRARSQGGAAPVTPIVTAKVDAAVEQAEVKHKERALLAATNEMWPPVLVAPGQTRSGVIRLNAEPLFSAQRLYLRVSFGSETHEFTFKVNP